MEHSEYAYLMICAQEVRKAAERALKEGEEFHVADRFTPLKCGLEAQAIIKPISLEGGDRLILRLRHKKDGLDRTALVRKAQHVFFPEKYVVVPEVLESANYIEHFAHADPPAPATP